MNRVTSGDYDCPRKVLSFLTDLHASFRMLNLRNDFLRKKFDGEFTSSPEKFCFNTTLITLTVLFQLASIYFSCFFLVSCVNLALICRDEV